MRILDRRTKTTFLLVTVNCLILWAQQTALAEDAKGPVFADGEAQEVAAFKDADYWIREDLWVETEFDSDGNGRLDRMHVSVTRPRQTAGDLKLPAIYVTSPYFAGTGSSASEHFWDPHQELGEPPPERDHSPSVKRKGVRPIITKSHVKTWVPRGFAVVHSSSPGTGLSDGCPTVGGDNESLAPKAVVEWLCQRRDGYTTRLGDDKIQARWCTGKVGMTGTSYNGTLPLAAATTGVKGLEAIIPIAPNTSYYHYYRSNGLIRHPFGFMGEDIDCLFDFIHSGDEANREYCECEVRDKEMAEGFDRVHGDYNAFWHGRDYLNDLEPLRAAVLMAHAFNDWNVVPEHSIRIYEALKKKGTPVQLYMHQGGHGGAPPLKLMNRWFTRYLHGVENGVEKDARSWIVRETDDRDKPTEYAEYPHPDAEAVRLHLEAGAPGRGALSPTAMPTQQIESLVDNYSFDGGALARAESTQHRLIYTSATLQQPVHFSGTARVKIRVASSAQAANLSVWLVSLPWSDGRRAKITDNVITRGWADPQNHESLTKSEPLVPGKFYELSFDLQPDDQIIPAGQEIGLMIFSSDRDFTLWPQPGTELTVDLSHTAIDLPVVGGVSAWHAAFEEDEAEQTHEGQGAGETQPTVAESPAE